MKRNSYKREQVNTAVQRALSSILREDVKDPRIPLMISVTKAVVAPDLKTCKAYISVLGDEQTKEDCRAALKSAAGYIRHELAMRLNLRLTPEITYILDDSIEYGVEMINKIDAVMEQQNAAAQLREPPETE